MNRSFVKSRAKARLKEPTLIAAFDHLKEKAWTIDQYTWEHFQRDVYRKVRRDGRSPEEIAAILLPAFSPRKFRAGTNPWMIIVNLCSYADGKQASTMGLRLKSALSRMLSVKEFSDELGLPAKSPGMGRKKK